MAHAKSRLTWGILGAALLLGACTVKKQETPSLTGPSELGTSLTITVSPDVLAQDGASQSLVTVIARDNNGQLLRNLSLRAEITVNGFVTDFGTLSARNLVTDTNGRATVTYTAPPSAAVSIDTGTQVQIQITPAGTDFGNATPRFASIRLVPVGIVTPPTNGLVPRFTVNPAAPTDHQTAIFDASTSTTTNASIVSYKWTFGDGDSGTGIATSHSFDDPGTFAVTLTVTDSIGRVNSLTQSITVGQGTKPTATIVTSPSSPIVAQQINFNGSTSLAAPGRAIRSFDWDFGDGTSASGALVSHAYANVGSFTVVLTVTDDAGRVGTATVTITVGTGNPTADFTFNPSAPRSGQNVTFDASATQAASGRTIVSYSWSFGNGNSGTGQTVTTSFTTGVTPTTYNVLLTVTDSAGKTSSVTKPITINP
jgi:PKD repeat protein